VTRFPGVARPGNKGVARKNQEAGIIPWSGRASHNLGLRNQGPFVIITKIISSGPYLVVIPAKAGIQVFQGFLVSRFRGSDVS